MAWRYVNKLEYYSKLLKRLKKLDDQLSKENLGFTKRDFKVWKRKGKTSKIIGGISEMKKHLI